MRKIVIEVPESCKGCQLRYLNEAGTKWYCPFQAVNQDNTLYPVDALPNKACRESEIKGE
jgi:hypothetical protein